MGQGQSKGSDLKQNVKEAVGKCKIFYVCFKKLLLLIFNLKQVDPETLLEIKKGFYCCFCLNIKDLFCC
jgi:hypothetical protein